MKRSLRVTVFGLLAASVFFFAFENRLLAAQTDSPGTSYELLVDFQIDDIDVSPDGKRFPVAAQRLEGNCIQRG